jgi:hypothetical protein
LSSSAKTCKKKSNKVNTTPGGIFSKENIKSQLRYFSMSKVSIAT